MKKKKMMKMTKTKTTKKTTKKVLFPVCDLFFFALFFFQPNTLSLKHRILTKL